MASLFGGAFRLTFRVLRLYADRRKVNMSRKSTERQAIEKHVVHAVGVGFDAGVTDFNPAAPKTAFPPERIRAMRGLFIDHDHR